jgi:hypothetical protein
MPVMAECEAAVTKAAAVENMAAAKAAAMETTPESPAAKATTMMEASTMEASAMKAAPVETTAATAPTMPTANLDGQIVGGNFGRRRRTGIDQRKRFGALVRNSRQHQYRSRRYAPAADQAAPGI